MSNCLLVLPKYTTHLGDPCIYPLGFMYMSAVLKKRGHTVKVIDYNLGEHELEKEMEGMDYVMSTGFEGFFNVLCEIGDTAKRRGVHSVVGGYMATFAPNEMLKHFDTVVVGEGEMVEHFRPGVIHPPKPDINAVPWPDYDGFNVEEYHRIHVKTGFGRYMGVLTSRGCPFTCSFCAHTSKFKVRDLDDVFREIDHYVDRYRIQTIVFNDDTLNIRKDRWMKMCEGMGQRYLKWGAALRADLLDEEMIEFAQKCGMDGCIIGVESLDQNKLNRMNKRIKADEIHRAMELLAKHKVNWHANILVGFEWETMEDIQRELASIPPAYKNNLFGCMVYHFIGTKNGATRLISDAEVAQLQSEFAAQAKAGGKAYDVPYTPTHLGDDTPNRFSRHGV